MADRIKQDRDVFLGLEPGVAPACTAQAVLAARSATAMSRWVWICCSPGTLGQVGAT